LGVAQERAALMIRFSSYKSIFLICCIGMLSACQSNKDSDVDNINKLVSLLEGEFDSGKHMRRDKRNEVPKEQAHGWVNRSFVKIDAPEVGDPVLVSATKYGGDKWTEDKYEFLVWTFSGDEDSDGIVMSPRRLKDYESRLIDARNATKLSGINPQNLEQGESGAACDILWIQTATGFEGTTDPCEVMSTTHEVMLNWIWEFNVTEDALQISFRGEDDNGKAYDATPSDSPYVLDRLSGSVEYHTGTDILFNTRDKADYLKAIEYLETAIEKEPENGKAHNALIYAYIKRNKYEDAAKILGAARALKPSLSTIDQYSFDALEARIVQDELSEIEAWKKVLAEAPKSRWAWWELATAYYRTEDYQAVVDAIDQALLVEPNERAWDASMLPYIHSKAHFRLGNYDAAIKTSEPGIRNESAKRPTYYRKILGLMASNQADDPTGLFRTYFEYSKRDGKVNESFYNANIALLYFELADYENAEKHARIGYALSPGFYQTFVLGYSMTENGKADEALNFFSQEQNDFPDNLYVQSAKGWAMYRLGKYKDAKVQYLKAKALGKRKNWAVERDLKIINAALSDPTLPQVEPVRWFGD